ncbi:MAG: sugar-binding transcriptional regulator, partial [Clostridiales bacterium]|nr:sugar-binding transcriptional regulator [Clostridiales bacterium]
MKIITTNDIFKLSIVGYKRTMRDIKCPELFTVYGTKNIHRDICNPGGVTFLENLLALQQKIVPEMVELLDKRFHILKKIYYNQPIGRRGLSQELSLGERIVRTEVNFLKDQGLIIVNSIGMVVTEEGENILGSLEELIHSINGLSEIEEKLQRYLNISRVIVVPGNLDEDKTVLKEMGRVAAGYIKNLITNNSIMSLTGGSSVAQVIDNFPKINKPNVLVVPARGGMGRDVETQANALASKLASKIGGNYKLLHVPDNISHEALETMMNEPDIKETIEYIGKTDILIFGIGRADEMSRRRGLSEENTQDLLDKGAVAEAFGYYFDEKGDIVYISPTMG